jgi:hypothetical protein
MSPTAKEIPIHFTDKVQPSAEGDCPLVTQGRVIAAMTISTLLRYNKGEEGSCMLSASPKPKPTLKMKARINRRT